MTVDLVKFVAEEVKLQNMAFPTVSVLAGHSHNMVTNWANRTRNPTVQAMQDVLNILGYQLVIADKHTLEIVYPEEGVPEK